MNNKSIVVLGLGAVGSNLLIQLARQFPDFQYMGVDFDHVEERNLGTQPYFIEHVGVPKATAMASILARHVKKVLYIPMPMKLEKSNMTKFPLPKNNLILDCFDNMESRKLTKNASEDVFHVGFSPEYTAMLLWDEKFNDSYGDVNPNAPDICTLPDALSFIGFVTSFAGIVVNTFLQTGQKNSYIITGKSKIVKV